MPGLAFGPALQVTTDKDRAYRYEGVNLTSLVAWMGNLLASIECGTAVSGALVPRMARSAVHLTAPDGGRGFFALPLISETGTVEAHWSLTLVAVGSDWCPFDGHCRRLKDVRIKRCTQPLLPVNAVSCSGMISELNGRWDLFLIRSS